jgi:phenylalanyl-tRNA synthetase beta chain
MKASCRWLRELCPALPSDAKVLAARFTAAGIPVDAIETFGAASTSCVVVRVLGSRPHPSRAQLKLVEVDRGGGAKLEVVCGAPNVPEPGGLVVLAPLGAYLPAKGVTIERRPIGGIDSEGMLCSEQELGLSDESAGILILPAGTAAPGTTLSDAIPASHDAILEIDLTPNRPDALGHVGLAREAAALFGVPFATPVAAPLASPIAGKSVSDFVSVTIEDGAACPHFGATVVTGVAIGPSPLAVRWRLSALGVRSISTVVDVTNIVMLESGHPLHAFDLDRVRGAKIAVRRAREGEKLVTLDGVERALHKDDLVVCDGEGAVGLAGIMGGGDSEISAKTTRVLLECAYFDSRVVRRAARRHGMHTEASHRFERGVDSGDAAAVLARARALVIELAGGSGTADVRMTVGSEIAPRRASLRGARLAQLLGTPVDRAESRMILEKLGLAHVGEKGDVDEYEMPTHRPDLSREVDLIEEVARVRGYEKIPSVLPAIRPTLEAPSPEMLVRRVREAAAELGLSEALTYAFVSPRALEIVGAPVATVVLKNPLHDHHAVMRTSLVPGLLEALSHAQRHGEKGVRMFSVGPLFLAGEKGALPNERTAFAAILAGERDAYLTRSADLDVLDAKGVAFGLVERLVRRDATARAFGASDRPKHLHPRAAAAIVVEGRDVGCIGQLHPDVADALEVTGSVVVVELDAFALDAIGVRPSRYAPIPRFPASARDVALVVHDDVAAGDVERAIREAAGALAEEVRIFDRFVGGQVPKDHASLALHVVYRAADRTLTDAEIDAQHAKVVAEVGKRFGATLRA